MKKLYIIFFISTLLITTRPCNADKITVDIIQSYIKLVNPYLKKDVRYEIAKSIERNCEKEQVSIILVMAMMENESSFYPNAISKAGAKGLMQIYTLKCNKKSINERRLFEIDYNIQCGICIYKDKLRLVGGNNWEAIKAYCGSGKQAEKYAEKVFMSILVIDEYISYLRRES